MQNEKEISQEKWKVFRALQRLVLLMHCEHFSFNNNKIIIVFCAYTVTSLHALIYSTSAFFSHACAAAPLFTLCLKRRVTYCNPCYINTGGALYWTLWVLPYHASIHLLRFL